MTHPNKPKLQKATVSTLVVIGLSTCVLMYSGAGLLTAFVISAAVTLPVAVICELLLN